MSCFQTFHQDCIVLVQERLLRGQIDRRSFLAGLSALGLAATLKPSATLAQTRRELRFANWGGIANEGYSKAYGVPFEAANPGVRVSMDSSGPSAARIRAMVEARKVVWDVCDGSSYGSVWLGEAGLLEPINYKIVDRTNVLSSDFALPYGVAPHCFSTVLA